MTSLVMQLLIPMQVLADLVVDLAAASAISATSSPASAIFLDSAADNPAAIQMHHVAEIIFVHS